MDLRQCAVGPGVCPDLVTEASQQAVVNYRDMGMRSHGLEQHQILEHGHEHIGSTVQIRWSCMWCTNQYGSVAGLNW